jgi:hypothetical protein
VWEALDEECECDELLLDETCDALTEVLEAPPPKKGPEELVGKGLGACHDVARAPGIAEVDAPEAEPPVGDVDVIAVAWST